MTSFYFTIIDFRNVTKLFADKDFDGDPVKVKETDGEIPTEETEEPPTEDIPQGEVPKRKMDRRSRRMLPSIRMMILPNG